MQIGDYKFQIGDEIIISDLLGREMENKVVSTPTSNFRVQTLNYPSGIYFLHIHSASGEAVKKFVKQ